MLQFKDVCATKAITYDRASLHVCYLYETEMEVHHNIERKSFWYYFVMITRICTHIVVC